MEKRIMGLPVAPGRFMRVHDRYIVALLDVEFDKNMTEVTVSNGDILPVSEKYRSGIDENFEAF